MDLSIYNTTWILIFQSQAKTPHAAIRSLPLGNGEGGWHVNEGDFIHFANKDEGWSTLKFPTAYRWYNRRSLHKRETCLP